MSDERDYSPPSDDAIRRIAAKGTAALDRMQTILERARAMLAHGEVAEPADGVEPQQLGYHWETTEPPPDARLRIWRATAYYSATGEGLTVWYGVGLARDDDEFRRQLSREFGRALAADATLGAGLDSALPFEGLFLSDGPRKALERMERGEGPLAAMSFFGRYYVNYS